MRDSRPIPLAALALAIATTGADAMEKPINFHMVRNEIDYGDSEEGGRLSWDAAAWIGGDRNKLWIKAEGEQVDRNGEQNEAWALYSRMISAYFDLQAGLRQDFEPETLSHVALGVQGLAPYMFETEAFAFVSENGDVSARFEQSIDLLLTQRLIAKPHVKLNAFAQDVPELAVGTGLSDLELGLQVRYEIERKFAPYVDLIWERKVGETASITRATGEDPSNLAIVGGIRFWF